MNKLELNEISLKKIVEGMKKDGLELFIANKEREIYSKVRGILGLEKYDHVNGLVHDTGYWIKEIKNNRLEVGDVIWAISKNNRNVRLADNLIKIYLMNNCYHESLEEIELWLVENYSSLLKYLKESEVM